MVYLKKLVMKGFKSFAKETEIPLANSMNVIVGPNGSGKSNITDAICFVLGRMSAKSMRATKSANLIFAGTKALKPCGEASVKLHLDNSCKKVPSHEKEIVIERIVRKNGQGIYKINHETKTRQEVLELLAQAGIDPYGFNMVLQGEIAGLVKMHSEERRKVIEEVAGISIYETRKLKSLRELEKTDDRLKEVKTTLRERTSYLNNLEEERRQALRYKKLQEIEKKCKAGVLTRKIKDKEKSLGDIKENQSGKEKIKLKFQEKSGKINKDIENFKNEIDVLNKTIQKSSGIEQGALNTEISNLRAELAGLGVRKDNNESRLGELSGRRNKLKEDMKNLEVEIGGLRKEFPSQAKKHKELEEKKKQLGEIENKKKQSYSLKQKLDSVKELLKDRERQLQKNSDEYGILLKQTGEISSGLSYSDLELCRTELNKFREDLDKKIKGKGEKQEVLNEKQRLVSVYEAEVSSNEKIKKQVRELDTCPLCKNKITEEHLKEVNANCDNKISELTNKIKEIRENNLEDAIKVLATEIIKLQELISKSESELVKLSSIEDKKERIKVLGGEKKDIETQVEDLRKQREEKESSLLKYRDVEDDYDKLFMDLQEISSRTKENINAEVEFKERDLEKFRSLIKQNSREEQDLNEELSEIELDIGENQEQLDKKESEEQELEKKFHKLIEKKNGIEKDIHNQNTALFEVQGEVQKADAEINNLKIEIARFDAEKENLEVDLKTFEGIKPLNLPIPVLQDKLNKAQLILQRIGSVNLRALEVYGKVKEEYDIISEKVTIIETEQQEILKIIEEIDKKKKKTFMRTLKAVNELFSRNFSQLSTKGQVFLELENREDVFAGGLGIVVKTGKGKYFDVTSLSGGEQSLVALSLIFAIQEHKPYCFYIFDEVDAALDKRNSERLAVLIKRYMKMGQYIIVTHNDAIITESSTLYGISMQDGLSKVLSLEI